MKNTIIVNGTAVNFKEFVMEVYKSVHFPKADTKDDFNPKAVKALVKCGIKRRKAINLAKNFKAMEDAYNNTVLYTEEVGMYERKYIAHREYGQKYYMAALVVGLEDHCNPQTSYGLNHNNHILTNIWRLIESL